MTGGEREINQENFNQQADCGNAHVPRGLIENGGFCLSNAWRELYDFVKAPWKFGKHKLANIIRDL